MGTFAVMSLLGYSLNNLSLMALTLSIGFLVDDAIVMLENIFRHQELGEDVREATLNGSKEIGFTIVSMTLSPGRGLHSHPVHGRDPRAAFPRVRRHHRRGRPLFRLRLPDPDPAPEQPRPQAPAEVRTAALYNASSKASRPSLDFYKVTLAGR